MEFKLQYKYEASRKEEKTEMVKMKLPKLLITKFWANHPNWLRFWNEFSVEILSFKGTAHAIIENRNGLPFIAEG